MTPPFNPQLHKVISICDKEIIIDIQDESLIRSAKWKFIKSGFIMSYVFEGFTHSCLMPRFIYCHYYKFDRTKQIRHKNNNIFDNRKCNLYEAVHTPRTSPNEFGSKRKHTLPKYVYQHKKGRNFQVSIPTKEKFLYIGVYDTIEKAIDARDKWLKENGKWPLT